MPSPQIRSCLNLSIWILALCTPTLAQIQPYCSLRDPQRTLGLLLPEYQSYRSIVRTIEARERKNICNEVGFGLHYDELGRHTLYRVIDKQGEIVIVNVRTEPYAWGLTEIVWVISPAGEILDYRFQRCRSRAKHRIESEEIKKLIRGYSIPELKNALDSDNRGLSKGFVALARSESDLLTCVIRSGITALATTRQRWGDIMLQAVNTKIAQTSFGKDAIVADLPVASPKRTPGVAPNGEANAQINNALLYRVSNAANKQVGTIVFLPARIHEQLRWSWWLIDNDNKIRGLRVAGSSRITSTSARLAAILRGESVSMKSKQSEQRAAAQAIKIVRQARELR